MLGYGSGFWEVLWMVIGRSALLPARQNFLARHLGLDFGLWHGPALRTLTLATLEHFGLTSSAAQPADHQNNPLSYSCSRKPVMSTLSSSNLSPIVASPSDEPRQRNESTSSSTSAAALPILPPSMANRTTYPPGCPVVIVPGKDSNDLAATSCVGGRVASVWSSESSGELQYAIETKCDKDTPTKFSNDITEEEEDECSNASNNVIVPESDLQFAPDCPIHLDLSAASLGIPNVAVLPEGEAGARLVLQNSKCTVLSGYCIPGGSNNDMTEMGREEDSSSPWMYSIRIELGDGNEVVYHGVPGCAVSYRHVGDTTMEHLSYPAGSTNIVGSKSCARPAPMNEVTPESNKRARTVPTAHVRRIELPDDIDLYGTILKNLIGKPGERPGETVQKLEGTLRCGISFFHPGRNKKHSRNLKLLNGNLAPRKDDKCIVLRGSTAEIVDDAVEVVIRMICTGYGATNDDYCDDEGINLKHKLTDSVRAATVEDEEGFPQRGRVESSGHDIEAATGKRRSYRNELESRCTESGRIRVDIPDWLDPRKIASAFIGTKGSNINRLRSTTGCNISISGKGINGIYSYNDEDSPLYVVIDGGSERMLSEAYLHVQGDLLKCALEYQGPRLLYDIEADRVHGIRSASSKPEGGPTVYQRSYWDMYQFVWTNIVAIPWNYAEDAVRHLMGDRGRRMRELSNASGCDIDIRGKWSQSGPYALVTGPSEEAVNKGVFMVRSSILDHSSELQGVL